MKNIVIVLAFLFAPMAAFADGFVCMSVDEDTRIDVHLAGLEEENPSPVATKLVVFDPNRSPRYRHIATFEIEDGVLQTSGTQIRGVVDISKKGTSRPGERIGGTRLGLLSGLLLDIDVTYQEPIKEGVRYAAEVAYQKKNGQELKQDFDCTLFKGTTPDKVQVVP